MAWVEGSRFGVRDDHTGPSAIFINSYTPYGAPDAAWQTLDFVAACGVPADTIGVFLSGMLIITHGTLPEIGDLTVTFRPPGSSTTAANYNMQCLEAQIGGGQRSMTSMFVPCLGGKVEWQWNRNAANAGQWPDHCAFCINLVCNGYVAP